ncbi:MAG TPA: bifunctional rhamnulose-1-phosphate aldolase/short-chain dehydrogenase [Polyangiaceae bacterium]
MTPEPANRWDEASAAQLSAVQALVYRSNLLGQDLSVTNYGGGNTSAKTFEPDPLAGEEVPVLWVKGSGGDLGSINLSGFATLYQDKLLALERRYRGVEQEDEMVDYLRLCRFGECATAPSIDTPLHAYLPFAHVDHMHPDAVIAIAASKNSQRLTQEVFEGEMGWLPWQRPGFDLGLRMRDLVRQQPNLSGIVLAGHGMFTWGETSRDCYLTTLRIIARAVRWLRRKSGAPSFGGPKFHSLSPAERPQLAGRLMPVVRGQIGANQPKVGHFSDSDAVLEFVNSERLTELAALGTSCPDHFLRTKIRPLVWPFDPERDDGTRLPEALPVLLESYRNDYRAYYQRCKGPDSPPVRDPNPVVYLVPGLGMFTFAGDKATARIAGEFYVNAINVMRGATEVDEYVGLSEKEAFNIEYWQLEQAKLSRMPKPKPLHGRIAYLTGGAGGIGRATAIRLLEEGACVVLVDRAVDALAPVRASLAERFGPDRVRGFVADVTDEAAVEASFRFTAVEYGGIDIIVSNAGLASAASVEETSLELWHRNLEVLCTGYFLVAREGFKLLKRQGLGGSMVFVGSKNGLVASAGAAAYCTAKASELHLARCLALEGAAHGIRVNTVNPDAVISGSSIWNGDWRKERALAYGIEESEIEEFYRNRSLLKQSVMPEDVAEAIYFFASERSRNSTGNVLNVDAGNAAAFTR